MQKAQSVGLFTHHANWELELGFDRRETGLVLL